MNDLFEKIYAFTASFEGGLVNHPEDPGGITNHGITLSNFLLPYAMDVKNAAFLKELGLLFPLSSETIVKLTKDQAEAIYRRAFWNVLEPDSWPPLTVATFFDASVNSGKKNATKFLQRACNTFDGPKLDVDGALGRKTNARVMEIGSIQAKDIELALRSVEQREKFLQGLSTFKTFGKGWMARTQGLKELIKKLSVEYYHE